MLSVKEVSIQLKISPQQVRNLCRLGKLPSQKVGNVWIVKSNDVKKYIHSTSSGVAEDQLFYGMNQSINPNKPIAMSFFSGAMGLDLGLEKAGFQTVFTSEIDNACRKTIVSNKPDIALVGDIRNYSAQEIRRISGLSPKDKIDVVVGGPPCQAFSTAGKRKAFEDERGNVFLNFINLITQLNPRYAVIENVRGLLSAPLKHRPHNLRNGNSTELTAEERPGGALNEIINRLEGAGYTVSFNLYNTANFGTPQKRERVVMICSREKEVIPYIEPSHSENGAFGLKKWRTVKESFKLLQTKQHDFVSFPEKRLKYYRMLKAGENWRALPEPLQKEALGASYNAGGGKTGFLRRLAWEKPSPTLVTHPAMPATDLAHPEADRPLSIQEYKVLQEFPDNWTIEGSLLDRYKQIGNAVPVGFGYAIGKHLLKLMNNEEIKVFPDFPYSRYRNTADKEWLKHFRKTHQQSEKSLTPTY